MERKYGSILREIRVSKGYTISQVSQGILSTSFLSKFERGEADMSLSIFIKIVERLNVSIEEFYFIVNDYNESESLKFIKNIKEAYINNNEIRLKEIIHHETNKWEKMDSRVSYCNSIMAEAFYLDLKGLKIEDEKKEFIVNYLFSIESWGIYELTLYGNTISVFPINTVILLSHELLKKCNKYKKVKKYLELLIQLFINTIITLLEYDRLVEAKFFFIEVNNINMLESMFYEKTLLLFLEGIYLIRTSRLDIGEKKAREAILIMNLLDENSLAINYKKYLEESLNSNI